MAFTVIETQEAFDAAIAERLERQKKSIEKEMAEKYADYENLKSANQSYEKQIADQAKTIGELTESKEATSKEMDELKAKLSANEKATTKIRVAHEMGIPYELAARLSGDDEDSIRKDAESLKGLIGTHNTKPQPKRDPEPENDDRADLRAVLHSLKGE